MSWHALLVYWGIMSTNDHNLKKTRTTYEKIAHTYADRNRDRSPIAADADRFINLLPSKGLVLDVGCGPGFDTAVFQQHNLQTIALDYAHAMMQAGKTDLNIEANFVQGDMRYLPFRFGQFDGIWASASMLHLDKADVPTTLAHFYDLLHPQGILYLSVKCGDGTEWTSLSYGHAESRFFTYWRPEAVHTVLQEAGFLLLHSSIEVAKAKWIVCFAQKAPA